MELFTSS